MLEFEVRAIAALLPSNYVSNYGEGYEEMYLISCCCRILTISLSLWIENISIEIISIEPTIEIMNICGEKEFGFAYS